MDRLKRIAAVRLALAVNARYGDDGGGHLAASLTYFGFLSLFPMMLLALAAIGFVLAGDARAQTEWADRLSGSIPGLGSLIGDNIDALVERRSGAGVIGIVGLIWSGVGLTNAASYATSRIFRRPEVQGLVKQRIWSLSATAALGLAAFASVGGSAALGSLRASGVLGFSLSIVGLIVALLLDVLLFQVSYRVLTAGGVPWRRLWPGALVAGFGWTVLKLGGAWYAARTVAHASEIYGTFGSVVGVLGILYLAARMFVCGAELNAVLIEEAGESSLMLQPTPEGEPKWPTHDSFDSAESSASSKAPTKPSP